MILTNHLHGGLAMEESLDLPFVPGGHAQETKSLPIVRGVVSCPHCGRSIKWAGRSSSKLSCLGCRGNLIILIERKKILNVRAEDDDAVGEMICDWLDEGMEDEDGEEEADESADAMAA
jgi:hypothetical protein